MVIIEEEDSRMSDDRIVVGAAQNVPNRIQQTRRDADSVIEEVGARQSFPFVLASLRPAGRIQFMQPISPTNKICQEPSLCCNGVD